MANRLTLNAYITVDNKAFAKQLEVSLNIAKLYQKKINDALNVSTGISANFDKAMVSTQKYSDYLKTSGKQALDGYTVGIKAVRNEFNSWSRAYTFARMWVNELSSAFNSATKPFRDYEVGLKNIGSLLTINYGQQSLCLRGFYLILSGQRHIKAMCYHLIPL